MSRADSILYAPRGLNRDEAARYVGVGNTKFDEALSLRRGVVAPREVANETID